jgi:hypothetical protein
VPSKGAKINERGCITVNMRKLERVKVIAAVAEHRLKVVDAAERLDLCESQVSRLVRRYEASDPAGLVSAGVASRATGSYQLVCGFAQLRSSVSDTPILARRWPARSCVSATACRSSRKRFDAGCAPMACGFHVSNARPSFTNRKSADRAWARSSRSMAVSL